MTRKQYRRAKRTALAALLGGCSSDDLDERERRVAQFIKRQWQTGTDVLVQRTSSMTPNAASRLKVYPMCIGAQQVAKRTQH
ncbi:hypothetical protein SAMN05421547_108227 [Delftia lacustris]|jgi:hypothetical protein|uniref:Uncharacterized protein n=1 Tax=Delftia lacustris TaxID=558537 RepID=A0A1H3N8Y9_9BURK|nr:hypothetical protein SAMN05421547_108227 [Delftia lacustris]